MIDLHTYINNDILPLLPNHPVRMAAEIFARCTHTHLPVVVDRKLMGNLAENDIHSMDPDTPIEQYVYSLEHFFVTLHTHWVDVLEAFAIQNSNIMPVLDEQKDYVGYYDLIDVVSLFKETPFLNEPGGIIVVEHAAKEYAFSTIAQIVESNNGRLLGAFVSSADNDRVEITLKVANTGINPVLQTFRRYGYTVISGYEDDAYVEDLKQRSAYLQRFLDM